MLEIDRLGRKFGDRSALDDVSCTIARGEIVGLIGPNGAGRSTLLRIVAGVLAPNSGRVRIGGHDIQARPLAAKRLIGYLPQSAPAYPDMTGGGFLRFVARLRGLRREQARRRIVALARELDLVELLDRRIAALPGHARRRLGIAQALLHEPPLLLLDEPAEGLDPGQRGTVRRAIGAAAPDKAIVIATNSLDDVEAICTRAIVLAAGQIRADDTPAALASRSHYRNAVRLVPAAAADSAAIAAELRGLAAIRSLAPASDAEGEGWWLFPWRGRPIVGEIAEFASERGWPVAVLRAERGRLEDMFAALVGGTSPVAAQWRDAA